MEAKTLKGMLIPLVTPLNSGYKVDVQGTQKLVDYVIAGGVNGLITSTRTGEMEYLERKEQYRFCEAVVRHTAGRAPVIAGITGKTEEETFKNLEYVQKLNPDFIFVAPLVYHSNKKLPEHLKKLAANSNLQILLYTNYELERRKPFKRENIRTELLKEISGIEKIIGQKSSCDIERFQNYMQATRGTNFLHFIGNEGLIYEAFLLGAAGAVPSIGNIEPKLVEQLYDNFIDGDTGGAEEKQDRIIRMRNPYLQYGSVYVPAALKFVLSKMNICQDIAFVPLPKELPNLRNEILCTIGKLKAERE